VVGKPGDDDMDDDHPPRGASPSASANGDPERLNGDEAKARWHEVRAITLPGFALTVMTALLAGVLWHRSADQMFAVGLGTSLLVMALLIWRHGVWSVSYFKFGEGAEAEYLFEGRRSPVARRLATPVLVFTAAFLFYSATSGGHWLLWTLVTIRDLPEAALGVLADPPVWLGQALGVVIVMSIGLEAVFLTLVGIVIFVQVATGHRRRPTGTLLLEQCAICGLGVVGVLAMAALFWLSDQNARGWYDWALEPFRVILSWF
jgi:hypothetical protein